MSENELKVKSQKLKVKSKLDEDGLGNTSNPPISSPETLLPSSLNQKLIEQAVQSGIHQGDLMLEVMGNIIAQRVSDGIESGTFGQNVKHKMKGVMNRLLPNLPSSEQEKKIEQIGDDDELTKFIDKLVSARLENDQKLLDNRQKQEKLNQQEEKRRKKKKQEKLETVNNWFFIFLLSMGLFTSGLLTGINVLPKGVVCVNVYSPCYWLRFDQQKNTLN